MVLTRHTHSNYTSVVWLLVLAAQNHTTDTMLTKDTHATYQREVLLLMFLDR